ncbi:MAG: hypothetical protein V3T40_03030 [Nitrososphaerales archaeon]
MNRRVLVASVGAVIALGMLIALVQGQSRIESSLLDTLLSRGETRDNPAETKSVGTSEELNFKTNFYRFEPQYVDVRVDCDQESVCFNARSIKFDDSGSQVIELLVDPLFTFGRSVFQGEGEFFSPSSVAIDSNDRIIVADTFNNNIQIFG